MKIGIFGLGYVGSVSMACFAKEGHHVFGVDINPLKVESINAGLSPIIEPGLEELLNKACTEGRLAVSVDGSHALREAQVVFICVGTPSNPNGSLDTSYIERVCCDIGRNLAGRTEYLVIAVRSTVLPGTAKEKLLPRLEAESGKTAGKDFGFCINPEFLREGSAVADFYNPPFTLIGELDEKSGSLLAELYSSIDAPLLRVPVGEAEMVKYASNAFHALKVVFANEIGNICKRYEIDSHKVMDIFVQDRKLNLSPYYLKPGFAFGGSCLGKDLRALLYSARQRDVEVPVLQSILPSNVLQIKKAISMVQENGKRKVGIIGLSFKKFTDDLRESPILEMAEILIGKGYDIRIYDQEISLSQLHGSNREYLDKTIPHITSLMKNTIQETMEESETIVVAKHLSEMEMLELERNIRFNQMLIELVRINLDARVLDGMERHGICW
jgi:GDP-mannose 6-dehydrogenase